MLTQHCKFLLPTKKARENTMKLIACLIIFGSVMASPMFAQDLGNSAAQSKIIALEKAWNQASKLRDTKAIAAILDDSIVIINDDGSLQSKSEFLAWVNSSKESDEQQVSPESLTVHMIGDVGVATGTFRTKETEDGKTHSKRDRFVDTWVKKGGSWTCVSAAATPMSH
jgi:ketosteroid isomerase-like protein